jgi:hypothetical protein
MDKVVQWTAVIIIVIVCVFLSNPWLFTSEIR